VTDINGGKSVELHKRSEIPESGHVQAELKATSGKITPAFLWITINSNGKCCEDLL
jgi:hypothetical protein